MILELRVELKKAIQQKDLKRAVAICKEMGVSLRYLCRMADVNVGNTVSYLNGNLLYFTESKQNRLFEVMEQFI